MELFSELYGCYYRVIGEILQRAHQTGLTQAQIDAIVTENAFSESGLHLIPKLLSGEWSLLREEEGRYFSRLTHGETDMPMTLLQMAWLKAVLPDRRMRLFLDEAEMGRMAESLADVEPLFLPADFHLFDAASDGDDYGDEVYIRNFRLALAAIRQGRMLLVEYTGAKGSRVTMHLLPERLQYSAKDDKFRLCGRQMTGSGAKPVLLNLARIKGLQLSHRQAPSPLEEPPEVEKHTVALAISSERNALERCMLQFAAYDKHTVLDEASGRHICTISYDPLEESELLIRILSFGPVVEVLEPAAFRQRVQRRVRLQIERMV